MVFIVKGNEAFRFIEQECAKTFFGQNEFRKPVMEILEAIRLNGDCALREIAERVGDLVPEQFLVSDEQMDKAIDAVSKEVRQVIERAAKNIRTFAQAVRDGLKPVCVPNDGYSTGMDYAPIERVGCYVPGGRYPLPSTALMTAVTARVAGVSRVYMVCPDPSPEVMFAARLASVDGLFRCGGAQAVAALTFGTETIPQVDMIVGPGNAFVTEAKRQVQGRVGIDMLAGPSEVALIADQGANADWIALEMLAQWEHDPLAKAWLFTDSSRLANVVAASLEQKMETPALPEFIRNSVERCRISTFDALKDCVEASNRVAPEHLVLAVESPEKIKETLENYGALFMGYNAGVAFGDYMAGPNHTLPTQGTALFSGGLNPLVFLRPQSWVEISDSPQRLANDTAVFAEVEGLQLHRAAALSRTIPRIPRGIPRVGPT